MVLKKLLLRNIILTFIKSSIKRIYEALKKKKSGERDSRIENIKIPTTNDET